MSILVEPTALTLVAGHDAGLAAQANDTAGQPIGGADLRFTAAEPRVLQVSAVGHVAALGPASALTKVIVASGRKVVSVPVVVLPGAPYRLETVSGDAQQLRAGEATGAPLVVRVVDQWNNPVSQVHLAATSTSGLFPSSEIVSATDGTVKFVLPPLSQSGAVVVLLKSTQDPQLSASFQLHVAPGLAAAIEELPATATTVSTPGSAAITLQVTDAYGNPVPDVALSARTSHQERSALQARTDAAGTATFLVPRQPRSRHVVLEVEVAGTPPIRRSFIDTSGVAAKSDRLTSHR